MKVLRLYGDVLLSGKAVVLDLFFMLEKAKEKEVVYDSEPWAGSVALVCGPCPHSQALVSLDQRHWSQLCSAIGAEGGARVENAGDLVFLVLCQPLLQVRLRRNGPMGVTQHNSHSTHSTLR